MHVLKMCALCLEQEYNKRTAERTFDLQNECERATTARERRILQYVPIYNTHICVCIYLYHIYHIYITYISYTV
jgi:hypothetical protein